MKGLLYFACCSQRIDSSPMVVHGCNVKQLTEEQQRLGCWRGFFKEATWIEGWNGRFRNRRVGSLEHFLHGFFPIHSTPQTQTQTHQQTASFPWNNKPGHHCPCRDEMTGVLIQGCSAATKSSPYFLASLCPITIILTDWHCSLE